MTSRSHHSIATGGRRVAVGAPTGPVVDADDTGACETCDADVLDGVSSDMDAVTVAGVGGGEPADGAEEVA